MYYFSHSDNQATQEWMQYVKLARHPEEGNLEAFMFKESQIYR